MGSATPCAVPRTPPAKRILSRGIGTQIAWIGPTIGVALILLGWIVWEQAGGMAAQVSDSEEVLLATMVFTSLAFVQLARALASRSFSEPIWRTGLRGERPRAHRHARRRARTPDRLVYLPFAQEIFGTNALTAGHWPSAPDWPLAILALMETDKARRGRSTRPQTTGRRPCLTPAGAAAPATRTARRGPAVRRATRGVVPLQTPVRSPTTDSRRMRDA